MTILGTDGQPTASNGPTGKRFEVVEECHNGAYGWKVILPANAVEMDKLEMAHVMNLVLGSLLQNIRTSVAQQKVKAAMQSINK